MPAKSTYSSWFFTVTIASSSMVFVAGCSESGTESSEPSSPIPATATTAQPSKPPTVSDEDQLTPQDLANAAALASNATRATRSLLEGEPLEAIAPLVGAWEIDAEWAWGQKLWGRSRYEVVLGGGWVEARAIVADAGADPYHRYTSLLGYDQETDSIIAKDFTSDGTVNTTSFTRTEEGGFESHWMMGETKIREVILPLGDRYDWDVWMQEPGSEDWSQVMDDAWTATDADMPRHTLPDLDPGLTLLESFIGEWTIDANWSTGDRLRARSIYSKDVGGRFIRAATYPTEGEDAQEYHRYLSFFQAVDDGIRVHGFIYDGSQSVDKLDIIALDPPTFEISTSQDNGSQLRQRVEMTSDDEYRWQVWARSSDQAEWGTMMDGSWKRVKETAAR